MMKRSLAVITAHRVNNELRAVSVASSSYECACGACGRGTRGLSVALGGTFSVHQGR